MKRKILVSALIAGSFMSPLAYATNGYFRIGIGENNEAMGGVGIALPQDSLAGAVNPAGMSMVGDHTDIGLTWFRPQRNTNISGNVCGATCSLDGSYNGNGESNFFVPDFGYNKMINSDTSIGISVAGAGGMNTHYNSSPFTAFGGQSPAGVNLQQLTAAPTWSMKLNPSNSVGIALNLIYQTFSANGLQPFDNSTASSNPGSVTNNGTDTSTGVGLRLGWTGQVTDMVTLGATYQPKTKMSKFSKYSGLFADQGSFDIPANYGVGIAVKANPDTTVGFDVVKIDYSGVSSVGDSPNVAKQFGSSGGPGFGWKDMTVYKLGVKYAVDQSLTLRAGYNHNTQQIGSDAAFINLLAPGVVQDHLTLGATWALANQSKLTVAYIHAFAKTVSGSIPAGYGGGTASIKMYEDSIGVMYGW